MKKQDLLKISYIPEVNLCKEWSLWSKCFGKVIVINGVSSSGKTTLTGHLAQYGFNKITIDDIYDQHYIGYLSSTIPDLMFKVKAFLTPNDFWKVLLQLKINATNYSDSQQRYIIKLQNYLSDNSEDIAMKCPSRMEVYDMIYNQAKKFIFSGLNVAIDLIMTSNSQIDLFSYCFNKYPMSVVLLYLPLEENLKQCFSRNYMSKKYDLIDSRLPSEILDGYSLLYKCVTKENINSHDVQLAKVNKNAIISVLKYAIYDSSNLLNQAYSHSVYSEKMKLLYDSIKKIYNSMNLAGNEDVFVVPLVKFDFIISGLKLRERALNPVQKVDLLELPAINLENNISDFSLPINEASIEVLGEDVFTIL